MGMAEEEKRIAIEKGSFHEGVPAIDVVLDGGWCKRTHKHYYNAKSGEAIIIGLETGKLLHVGVRISIVVLVKLQRNKAKNHRTMSVKRTGKEHLHQWKRTLFWRGLRMLKGSMG